MDDRTLLSIHHVGGRGGDRRFPVITAYEGDVVNVLYDGDDSAVDDMKSATEALASRTIVLPLCLGKTPGAGTLHVLNTTAGSSLLPFRTAFFERFPSIGAVNFLLDAQSFASKAELPVTITTLDDCLAAGLAPVPDFLSINTQGTELDIIEGAAATLRRSVIAVQAEISLYPLYDGQAELSDITRHLHDIDFWLADLVPHSRYSPSIALETGIVVPPIGFRRGGICLQTEAIFFKSPGAIMAHHADPALDLAKGVYIAIVLGNYSMSYCYADLARGLPIPDGLGYLAFSKAFIGAAATVPHVPIPNYLELAEPAARRRARYFEDISPTAFRAAASVLLRDDDNEVEQVCRRFGFGTAADQLREYRLIGIRSLCSLVGEDSAAPPPRRGLFARASRVLSRFAGHGS